MKRVLSVLAGITMPVLHCICANAQKGNAMPEKDKATIIHTTIKLLYNNYIFPGRVKAIEQYTTAKLASGGYAASQNCEAFLAMLNDDLEQQGHDHHLDIFYSPARVKQIIAQKKDTTAH